MNPTPSRGCAVCSRPFAPSGGGGSGKCCSPPCRNEWRRRTNLSAAARARAKRKAARDAQPLPACRRCGQPIPWGRKGGKPAYHPGACREEARREYTDARRQAGNAGEALARMAALDAALGSPVPASPGCAWCGGTLAGRDPRAVYCGTPCRGKAARQGGRGGRKS